MRGKLGDRERVLHMLEAIDDVRRFTNGMSYERFLDDRMVRLAVVKSLEIIGEAANMLSEERRAAWASVPWRQIIDLRHILVHEYFGIDNKLVWTVVENDIDELEHQLKLMLDEMPDTDPAGSQ